MKVTYSGDVPGRPVGVKPRTKILDGATYLSVAAALGYILLASEPQITGTSVSTEVILAASIFTFFLAVAMLPKRPRMGCYIGLTASLLALGGLLPGELFAFSGINSWVGLNLGDQESVFRHLSAHRLVAFALAGLSISTGLLRVLPSSWTWRGRPIGERVWPGVVACVLVFGVWYVRSVSPYRIPMIVDGRWSDLAILHVEKRGLQFHESCVSVYSDAQYAVERNDRRLFEYSFREQGSLQILPESIRPDVWALLHTGSLHDLETPAPRPLRSWNAEGWYVRFGRGKFLAFTTESGNQVPPEIIQVFHEIEALPTNGGRIDVGRDVCLGFCYDPYAGLGVKYFNDRCRSDRHGTRCF